MGGLMRTEKYTVYPSQIKGPITKAKLLDRFIEYTKPPDNCFVELLTTTIMEGGRIEVTFNLFDL